VNNILIFGQHEIINSVSVHENSICIIRSEGGGESSTQKVECINELMVGGSYNQLEKLNAGKLLFMYTSKTYSTPCTPGLIKQSKKENVQTMIRQAKINLARSYTF